MRTQQLYTTDQCFNISSIYVAEREKLYIFSSDLGLIRCLTPTRINAIIYSQAFLERYRNTTNIADVVRGGASTDPYWEAEHFYVRCKHARTGMALPSIGGRAIWRLPPSLLSAFS